MRYDLLKHWYIIPATILYSILIVCLLQSCARAEEIDLDRWADAIFKAENSVNHPYGILMKGCDKDNPEYCRKICKNTVFNTLVKYRETRCKVGESDIDCLQRRYCPIGSDTDNGTCQYWKKNVLGFLK